MKNGFLKLCSMVLVIVLLANMLPMSSFAEEFRESLTATQIEPETSVDTSNVEIVEEITEKRTQYTKEFLLSNGLHMAAVYPDAVHYETDNGWAEIDNTLKAATDGTYTNTAGVWNVCFPQQLSGAKSIIIEKDGYTLSFAMAGELRSSGELMTASISASTEQLAVGSMQQTNAQINALDMESYKQSFQYEEMAPIKNRSRLTYANIYQNTDVIYDLDSNRVKESIVMDSYSSTLRGYRYTLNVGTMIPVLEEDGSITFYDPGKKNVIMVMPAPYLVDAAEEYNDDIEVQLTGKGSTYTLSYLLPQNWLAEESRQWPVILDPVITASTLKTNIKDVTVSEGKTYDNNWGMLQCGHSETYGLSRFYVMYENLPVLKSSDVVVAASLSLYKHAAGNNIEVDVHKVNTTWTAKGMVWSNKPAYNTTVEDYAIVGAEGWYSWDITDAVCDWYAGDNTGVMFKLPDSLENTTSHNIKQFRSVDYGSQRPTLTICFRNNNGLESYWDYTASSAGRAGTGYVNNFTGNLVFIREDLGVDGNRMPLTISHVYNVNDADNNSFGMGLGWRTNLNQLVYQWSANTNYYVWEDGDGTDHYFEKQSDGTYKDEDGLELTLTTNGSGTGKYCITDKNGNKSFFDTYGRLRKIENNQQTKSSITVSYTTTSGKLIDAAGDGIGRWYKFFYTDGLLTKISARDASGSAYRYILFGYTDSKMTKVTTYDGEVCTYGYTTDGLLSTVQDIDGYKLSYAYNSIGNNDWQPYRVAKVSESDGSAKGGELNITYAHNQTTFTDHNDNVEIHQFNDFGNTVSIQDDEGHAQFTQYDKNTYNDETGKANQLRLSSRLQNSVGSLAQDSSFENGTVWSAHGDGVTTSTTSETAYLGSKSLKIVSTTSTQTNSASSALVHIAAESTVTFSAYVKNPNAATRMELHYYDSALKETIILTSPEIPQSATWQRVEMTLHNPSASVQKVYTFLRVNNPGTYYVDCLQIEYASTASRYNLVVNGDFRHSGVNSGSHGWIYSSFTGTDGPVHTTKSAATNLDTFAMQITGSATATKQFYQSVAASGSAGDTYVLSGWAKGDSVPLSNENRTFCLKAVFYNTDGSTTVRTVNFNPDTNSSASWQYVSAPVIANKAYSSIRVYAAYGYNANTVLFDGIQLYKEEFGNSYTYDDKGNVISVKDLQKQTTTYEYDTTKTDLLKIKQSGNAKMTYTYDSYHNVKTATTGEGIVYSFTYDAYGNNKSVSITKDGVTMTSTATYSDDGNLLVSTTDALGKVTQYGYNETTNVLEWVQYPEDTEATRTNYSYDAMYRLASAACTTDTGSALTATYTYADDLLTKIQTGSTTYNFAYGDFSLRTGVSIGDRELASYSYTNDKNCYLSALDYGNDCSVQYTYDKKGRVTQETFEDGDTVTYTYDNNGVLAKVTDSATGITTTYYYDSTDRLMKYVESGTDYSHSVGYEYDTLNNLTKLVETINGVEHTTSYTYDDDNRVESVTNGVASEHYSYDGFGRVNQQTTKHNGSTILTQSAIFQSPASGKTSAQVATYTVDASGYDITYTYTYDDNGNILSISDGTNTTSYVYDSANQLLRENNQAGNYTHTWTYDNAGNILSRTEYAYTTGSLEGVTPTDTITYTYGDEDWGDLLTGYDGNTITSDAIGNMTSDGTWTYTWEHGRELASMSNGTETWTYAYDANGMRTQRTDGTSTYSYVYNGSQLSQMTAGPHTLDFAYDANGAPLTVTWNGTTYYYVTNLQGDVTAILDSSGTAVVGYKYDAWGNVLSSSGSLLGSLGILNPLFYRGYVYDIDTGLYYLQSRYYNPEMGRFINADAFAATGQGFAGNNMFAYCGNNSSNNVDPSGTCYYNASGQWCHDNWEYLGGYQRKPDPGYYVGTTPTEVDVYVVPNKDYVVPPGSVKAIDKRASKEDPNIQIVDSYKITERNYQLDVLEILINFNQENPSEYAWKRTVESLIVEWDAHNHIYFVYNNIRCQHVDFNNKDEGVTYLEFWERAITSKLQEWGLTV